MSKPAVLLITFNRPDATSRVFAAIRQSKPQTLYIASDGPRPTVQGEYSRVQNLRQHILGGIDWPCQVKTLFRDKNLGCGRSVSEAISWLFASESHGIILEDDCVPDQSFFPFCAELLHHYRNEPQIMHIAGTNSLTKRNTPDFSYEFARTPLVWGWATWARAWQEYDLSFSTWRYKNQQEKTSALAPFCYSERELAFRLAAYDSVLTGACDTWDHQWVWRIAECGGLAIIPKTNLIENIGFDRNATHTKTRPGSIPSVKPMPFPLVHTRVELGDFDKHFSNVAYQKLSIPQRGLRFIRNIPDKTVRLLKK